MPESTVANGLGGLPVTRSWPKPGRQLRRSNFAKADTPLRPAYRQLPTPSGRTRSEPTIGQRVARPSTPGSDGALHHLYATPADKGHHGAVLLLRSRQHQAGPTHIGALPDFGSCLASKRALSRRRSQPFLRACLRKTLLSRPARLRQQRAPEQCQRVADVWGAGLPGEGIRHRDGGAIPDRGGGVKVTARDGT